MVNRPRKEEVKGDGCCLSYACMGVTDANSSARSGCVVLSGVCRPQKPRQNSGDVLRRGSVEAAFWCPCYELESECETQQRLCCWFRIIPLFLMSSRVSVSTAVESFIISSEHVAALGFEASVSSRGMSFYLRSSG